MMQLMNKENLRIVSMPGVSNFRDLGGYPTRDGRTVKWGQLYRSGHLAALSSRGLESLAKLNLHTVVDFRSGFEIKKQPDQLPAGTEYLHLPVLEEANETLAREIRHHLMNRDYEGVDLNDHIFESYGLFPTQFTPEYKAFIHTLLKANGSPVLWHCTAGKDRTGFAAAILLRLLGVDQQIIYEDYMLSVKHAERFNKNILRAVLARGFKAYKMMKPLLTVQKNWIENAFASLENEWGNFQSYVNQALGLSAADVRKLQDALLD